jgi:hypothetical protein
MGARSGRPAPPGRENQSRPVRRSPKAAFALRATARPQYEGRATPKRRRGGGGRDI